MAIKQNKISKRTFIKSLFSFAGLFYCRQVQALDFITQVENQKPNSYQADLIKNPKKQILIADLAECAGWPPGPFKMKCQSGDS